MARLDRIELGELHADVVRKDIKHVHLSVYPPEGRVHISAPKDMALDTIRIYAITKLDWIKLQQRKLRSQERETPREYLDKESHYLWGKRYLLKNLPTQSRPSVELRHSTIVLHTRVDSKANKKRVVLEAWYREQLKVELPTLLEKWQPILGVKPSRVLVQRMKTKWGSCNPVTGIIRLNTDLARKPPACLEYILVHELVHLLEPTHNAHFQALMDKVIPNWLQVRRALNLLPLRSQY